MFTRCISARPWSQLARHTASTACTARQVKEEQLEAAARLAQLSQARASAEAAALRAELDELAACKLDLQVGRSHLLVDLWLGCCLGSCGCVNISCGLRRV